MKHSNYLDGSARWLGKTRVIRPNALTFPHAERAGTNQSHAQHLFKTQASLNQNPVRCTLSGLTIESRGTRFLMKWANDINMAADKALIMH